MPSRASDGRPIFLVGMMGAGKSAVGAGLATRLGRRFVDLDRAIEARAGRTIPELFASDEAGFRALEAEVLVGLAGRDSVVATGGGVVLRPGNLEHMLASGEVVYLRAEVRTLLARLGEEARLARPLLALAADPEARLRELLRARGEAYARARITVDTDGRTLDQVVEALVEVLG